LDDARGGPVVFDARGVGFTNSKVIQVLVSGPPVGEGAAFLTGGGMMLGPRNVRIGTGGGSPTVDPAAFGCVAIGWGPFLGACGSSVVVGSGSCVSDSAVSIGDAASVNGLEGIAVGAAAIVQARYSVGLGPHVTVYGEQSSLIGYYSEANGSSTVVAGPSNKANSNFDVAVGSTLTTPINGSGVQSPIFIPSVADAGGGSVTITPSYVPPGLANGQVVVISGTTSYNGTYPVSNVTPTTFDIVATWVASETGAFNVKAANGYNVYVGFNIAGVAGTGNAVTRQVAVGTDIVVLGSRAVALGSGATIYGDANIAIGDGAKAGDSSALVLPIRNIAIGQSAMVNEGTGSVVVGYFATSDNNGVVGIGHDSKPIGEFAVCVGASAQAVAGGIAIGATAGLTGAYSNQRTLATALCAIAIGSAGGDNSAGPNLQPAHATGQFAIAVGTGSTAPSQYSVAVGYAANVDGSDAIAVGNVAFATAADAIAVGSSAAASAADAVAVGHDSKAFATMVVAVGRNAWGFGDSSVVVGTTNTSNDNFDVLVGSRLTTPINGASAVMSGTVDSVSDGGGGSVVIHSSDIPAGLATGQQVAIAGTTIYDGTFAVSNVTAGTFKITALWSATAVGTYAVRAMDGYNVYVGVNIHGVGGTGNADTHNVAVGFDMIVLGSSNIAVGWLTGSTAPTVNSSVVIGAHANVSHYCSQVYGVEATSSANNQVVFGQSGAGGGSAGQWAVHQLVVRGYNGGALNTLDAVDNPVDSGDPNLAVSGLTVVVTQSTVVTNKTLKAAPFASLPGGALVAYLE
jgi:hypothetical protein